MVHRRELKHPALAALDQAIGRLATAEGWCEMPRSGWLASADREVLAVLRPCNMDARRALGRHGKPSPVGDDV
jgi:hypothetical protein